MRNTAAFPPSSSGRFCSSAMLRVSCKQITAGSLRIRLKQAASTPWMCFAADTASGTNWSDRGHRGITEKWKGVIGTTKNDFTMICASIPSLTCRCRWSGICTVPTTFPWRFSDGKVRIRFKRFLAGDDLSSTRRPDSLSLIIFSSFWSHIIDKYTVPKKFLPVSHRNSSTYFARKFKPPDLLQNPKDLLLIKIFVKPTVRIGILSDQRLIEIEQAIQSLQISLNCSVQNTFKILLRHVPSPSCNALRNAQSARECLL